MLIEQYLQQFIGNSPVLYMLTGLTALVLINLIVSLVLAHQSKDDDINFELLPDFIKPLLLYGTFLICGEAVIVATKDIHIAYEAAKGFQAIAFVTIVLKYFRQIYTKLKALGMETDASLDKQVEGLDPSGTIQKYYSNGGSASKPVPPTKPVDGRPQEDER